MIHIQTALHTLNKINATLAAMLLALLAWVFVGDVAQTVDIGLYDESNYLADAWQNLFPKDEAVVAPSYALWYKFLFSVFTDPVRVYFVNLQALSIATPCVVFSVLIAWRVRILTAFLVSILVLYSSANLPIWPKVSQYAILIILISTLIGAFMRDRLDRMMTIASGIFIGSYARPELFIAFLLLSAYCMYLTYVGKHRPITRRMTRWAGFGVFVALIFSIWSLPTSQGNRSWIAFGQHYSINYVQWSGDSRKPWAHWEAIMQEQFGEAKSFSEALRASPFHVAKHMARNAIKLPYNVFRTISPAGIDLKYSIGFAAILVVFGITMRRSIWHEVQIIWSRIRRKHDLELRDLTIVAIAIFAPITVTMMVIAPRFHYLNMPILFALVLITIVIDRAVAETRSSSVMRGAILLPLLAVVYSAHSHYGVQEHGKTVLPIIRHIETWRPTEPVIMLEGDGGYCIYLPYPCKRVAEYDKRYDEPFDQFMIRKNINVIVVTPALGEDERFSSDQTFLKFIDHPEQSGFEKLKDVEPNLAQIFRRQALVQNP